MVSPVPISHPDEEIPLGGLVANVSNPPGVITTSREISQNCMGSLIKDYISLYYKREITWSDNRLSTSAVQSL